MREGRLQDAAIGVSMFLIVVIGVAMGSVMPIAFKVSCRRLTN